MKISLTDSSIVLLGERLTPALITPQWIKEECGLEEDPVKYLNSNMFSFIESPHILVFADDERFQASPRGDNPEYLKKVAQIARRFVEAPGARRFKAMGLNFTWMVEGEVEPLRISVKINDKDELNEVIEGHTLRFGAIIHAEREPYILKLHIEPAGENTYLARFNYHHDVINAKSEDIAGMVEKYTELYSHSEGVLRMMAGGDPDA